MASNTPEMINYGFSILPGTENFMAIKSEAIQSTEDVHGIDIEFRNCFLEEERSLKYYSHYSYLNCFLECGSNYTFKVLFMSKKYQLNCEFSIKSDYVWFFRSVSRSGARSLQEF